MHDYMDYIQTLWYMVTYISDRHYNIRRVFEQTIPNRKRLRKVDEKETLN